MPMDFPDMNSLKAAARIHGFRIINNHEPEDEYREALADHVRSTDFLESLKIRNKVGWNKFTEEQNADMLKRGKINFNK